MPWPVVKASSSVSGNFFCYDVNNRIMMQPYYFEKIPKNDTGVL